MIQMMHNLRDIAFKELLDSLNKPLGYWTWKCKVCNAVRQDEFISVAKYKIDDYCTVNVKYCNDNMKCISEAMKKENWDK